MTNTSSLHVGHTCAFCATKKNMRRAVLEKERKNSKAHTEKKNMASLNVVTSFTAFAITRSRRHLSGTCTESVTCEECVDVCLDAMEKNDLYVCATENGFCRLWETYFLSRQQWLRLCRLLERKKKSNSILWQSLLFIQRSECESWIEIEYLWTDLEAAEMYLVQFEKRYHIKLKILVCELERRKAWAAGTRRAWLTAVLLH